MSLEDFNTLLLIQDYKCAICGKPHSEEKKLHVDHDHDTGNIRGLLCHTCNTSLGKFGDNLEGMQIVIEYLTWKPLDINMKAQ